MPEPRGSHVSNLRLSCSSGSCASLTLFMDRARPARYLHSRYEDEKSGDRDLISAVANLFGWLGLRKSIFELTIFFPVSYKHLSRSSLALFRKKGNSLNRYPQLTIYRWSFLLFDLSQFIWTFVLRFGFCSKEIGAMIVVSMKICFSR